MMTFGISEKGLPMTYEGEIKNAYHQKWLARQRAKEQAIRLGTWKGGIDLPIPHDILLGRGRTFQDFSGNVRMRHAVVARLETYIESNKAGKQECFNQIFNEIKNKRGRFLTRRPDGFWEEVTEEVAKSKIAVAFRTTLSSHKISAANRGNPKLEEKHPSPPVNKRMKMDVPIPHDQPCFSFGLTKRDRN